MKITPFFRWYDLWIGAYVDRPNRTIYICPIPMFGVKIVLSSRSSSRYREAVAELQEVGRQMQQEIELDNHV